MRSKERYRPTELDRKEFKDFCSDIGGNFVPTEEKGEGYESSRCELSQAKVSTNNAPAGQTRRIIFSKINGMSASVFSEDELLINKLPTGKTFDSYLFRTPENKSLKAEVENGKLKSLQVASTKKEEGIEAGQNFEEGHDGSK